MCGIVGFLSFQSSKDKLCNREKLLNALNSIEHRGPDKLSGVIGKNFFFGSARLAIEAINYGNQPFFSKDKRFVLIFNGEIFNYKNLIKKFFKERKIISEGDLLLNLFLKFDESFVDKIKGQFAISIYDTKKNILYLYRDRFGIRPLYYYRKNNRVIFSSEIKSIVNIIEETPNIDKQSLLNTATFWTNIGNKTAFENIIKLESGQFLKITKKSFIKKKYFLNNFYNQDRNLNINNSELRNKLRISILNQTQSEIGYASYLSGGIDSSVIAYELSRISKKKLETFSVMFENKEYDESKNQKIMSNFLGTRHNSILIKNNDIYDNFSNAVNHAETFLFRTAPIPMYLLSKLVNKNGHKVVFSGEGADEVMLGYDIFSELKIRKFWSRNPNSNIRGNLFLKLYGYLPQFKNSRYAKLSIDFFKSFLSKKKDIFFSHTVRWSQFDYLKNYFINKNFDSDILIKKFKHNLEKEISKIGDLNKAQIIEFETLLANYLLSTQGDKMSMAHSVETRVPYLDDDFVEFISKCNPKLFLQGVKGKHIFRKAYKGILPKEIIDAPKIAYQAPEAKVFFNKQRPKELVFDFMSFIKKNKFLDYKMYDHLIQKILNTDENYRVSFRENFAFIIGISYFCLIENSKNWTFKKNKSINKKININLI